VKKILVALCLTLIATSAFGASFASDEQALRKLDRDQAIATYMARTEWFRLHLADDYILVTADGTQQSKAELIESLTKPGPTMGAYETTEVEIRAYGTTAIVTGRMIQKYTVSGEHVTADVRYSNVWFKAVEGWIEISSQISPISIKRERVK
jgi:hypothetical protein